MRLVRGSCREQGKGRVSALPGQFGFAGQLHWSKGGSSQVWPQVSTASGHAAVDAARRKGLASLTPTCVPWSDWNIRRFEVETPLGPSFPTRDVRVPTPRRGSAVVRRSGWELKREVRGGAGGVS